MKVIKQTDYDLTRIRKQNIPKPEDLRLMFTLYTVTERKEDLKQLLIEYNYFFGLMLEVVNKRCRKFKKNSEYSRLNKMLIRLDEKIFEAGEIKDQTIGL